MAILDPALTTIGDLCIEALKEASILGIGQSARQDQIVEAWSLIQHMLMQWQRKSCLIYHKTTRIIPATGKLFYSVGLGGDFKTGGSFSSDFSSDFDVTPNPPGAGYGRPDKITSAFIRQNTGNISGQVDKDLAQILSRDDYNKIALKSLPSFTDRFFYDPSIPLGFVYFYPVPNLPTYSLGITFEELLPTVFLSINSIVTLPFEYFRAITTNGALELKARYGIVSRPGDTLIDRARDALNVIVGASTQPTLLETDPALASRSGGKFNIFNFE